MSYGRDRDAHHRGVGAVAAADHLRTRGRARKRVSAATRRRDQALARLTYGRGGGLSGYGALEQLGAIKVTGTPMDSAWRPAINYGGGPDAPPPKPNPQTSGYRPGITGKLPTFQPGTGGVIVPPITAVPPRSPQAPIFTPVVVAPTPVVSVPGVNGSAFCSRAQILMGVCPGQATPGSKGGGAGPDGSGQPSSGGSSSLPPVDTGPDIPEDGEITTSSPSRKTALIVGGLALGAYLLWGRS